MNSYSGYSLYAPKQARSAAKLERVLHAARELLNEKSVAQLNMSEVADRAGVAVGTVYTRFKDREALLQELFRRFQAERDEALEGSFSLNRWRGQTLKDAVGGVIAITVTHFTESRGLVAAFTEHLRQHPEMLTPEFRERSTHLYNRVCEIFLIFKSEISHPNAEAAVRFAYLTVTSTCQSYFVYPNDSHPTSVRKMGVDLCESLSDAVYSYLTGSAHV